MWLKEVRIGVVIQEITNELAESFGLRKAVGALVNSVEPGGPADLAGIETSDIILRFGNKHRKRWRLTKSCRLYKAGRCCRN